MRERPPSDATSDALALSTDAAALELLAPTVDAARAFVAASRSAGTRRIYEMHWRHFVDWMRALSLEPLPAKDASVALYLAARATEGCRPATLRAALAAISQAHRLAGFDSPRDASAVREVMRGIRRSLGVAQTQKAPVLLDELRAVVGALPETTSGARDRALLLVGWAGAFRRAELVALRACDAAFTDEGLVLTVRRSKTDQEAAGVRVGLPYGSDHRTCPVRALRAWMQRATIEPSSTSPLFRAVTREQRVREAALSPHAVALIVKRSVAAVGLEPARFAGHSLRSGLATVAAKAGKPDHAIMKQGRWKSRALLDRYVRDTKLFDDNAAAGIGL